MHTMKELPLKVCPQCKSEFRRYTTTYCSRACYYDFRRKRRLCKQCGAEYIVQPLIHAKGQGKWYCSKTCYAEARRKVVHYICQRCGDNVINKPYWAKGRRYCDTCKNLAGAFTRSQHKVKQGRNRIGIAGYRADLALHMRSRWEANFARYLKAKKIAFCYEPTQFAIVLPDGKTTTYTPDFLIQDSYFIEVKGWLRPYNKMVLANAIAQLPKPLYLLQRTQYEWLEKYSAPNIPNWEYTRPPKRKHHNPVGKP